MGIYKQTDTKHTQVRIEQASSAKNCSEGEMLRHFNALLLLLPPPGEAKAKAMSLLNA